jgi:hypothetical protein
LAGIIQTRAKAVDVDHDITRIVWDDRLAESCILAGYRELLQAFN